MNEEDKKLWIPKEAYAEILSLREQLAKEQELRKELVDGLSQLMYAMNTTGLPWNTDSTVEAAYAKCKSLIKRAKDAGVI